MENKDVWVQKFKLEHGRMPTLDELNQAQDSGVIGKSEQPTFGAGVQTESVNITDPRESGIPNVQNPGPAFGVKNKTDHLAQVQSTSGAQGFFQRIYHLYDVKFWRFHFLVSTAIFCWFAFFTYAFQYSMGEAVITWVLYPIAVAVMFQIPFITDVRDLLKTKGVLGHIVLGLGAMFFWSVSLFVAVIGVFYLNYVAKKKSL